MKFAVLPEWTKDRACVSVDTKVHTMAFPMPGSAETITPAALTEYPFTIPLTQGVEWWWRVKRWQLDVNLTLIGAQTIVLSRGADTSERDRCVADNYVWTGTLDASIGATTRKLKAEFYFLPAKDIVIQDDNAWHDPVTIGDPYALEISNALPEVRSLFPAAILMFWTDPEWVVGSDVSGAFVSHTDSNAGNTYYSTHNATIDGVNMTMAWDSGGTDMTSATITMTILEWWPWASSDGNNPTWNSTTGERV